MFRKCLVKVIQGKCLICQLLFSKYRIKTDLNSLFMYFCVGKFVVIIFLTMILDENNQHDGFFIREK